MAGLGRFPGGGNGTPLQYSCLENPMDKGAWWATVHGVSKNRTQLSDLTVSGPGRMLALGSVTHLCFSDISAFCT